MSRPLDGPDSLPPQGPSRTQHRDTTRPQLTPYWRTGGNGMAGAMRKMAVYLGLVDDDRYYEDEAFDDRYAEDTRDTRDSRAVQPVADNRGANVAQLADRRPRPAPAPAELSRIAPVHPRTYNDARAIGEQFRDGIPVIMNLSDMADADAKRLVDFAAGLIFGMRGTMERVTAKVFLLSPPNVTVTAEDRARIAESSFYNQS